MLKSISKNGSVIEIHADGIDGPLISSMKVNKSDGWTFSKGATAKSQQGIHDLFIVLRDENPVEIDWIRFK